MIELLNNAIHDKSSYSEIVPQGVKAKRIFWNRELNKWYGVDFQVYRRGEKIKTSEDCLIVGNLPRRCYNMSRGSCSLRPEIYENLDSPRSNKTSGLMSNNFSYSKAMFPVRDTCGEIREDKREESLERESMNDEELQEERERRKEEAKERWSQMMDENRSDDDEREYDDE